MPAREKRLLCWALGGYAVFGGLFAIAQTGYVNADFVAYATIAHRWIERSPVISGCWSPLFSWLLTPLLALRVPDLLAGRVLLLAFGAIYVVTVHAFACRILPDEMPGGFAILCGTVACAVLQATLWANNLLDPDLIAAALLFTYFALTQRRGEQRNIPFFAGTSAGLAFLAKAYMLPFIVTHAVLLRPFRRAGLPKFLAGMLLIALPWIAIVSWHLHHFTISTAGSSNHANLSPSNYGRHLLWNPGLVRDYIIDPRLGPDWSPFRDTVHLQHQLRLIAKNAFDTVSQIASWLLLAVAGAGFWFATAAKRERPDGSLLRVITWCAITGALSAAGYWFVQIQPRYFMPVAAPLLCLAGLCCFARAAQHWQLAFTPVIALLLVAAFSVQDDYRLLQIATRHPQSHQLSSYVQIARQIQRFGGLDQLTACNRWHEGLIVAYAARRVRQYLGTPNAGDSQAIERQLDSAGAAAYIRWMNPAANPAALPPIDRFVPRPPWQKLLTIQNPANRVERIEFYARGALTGRR